MNKQFRSNKAFSLIEIMAVLSVMSILLLTAAPSVTSLLGADGPTRAASEASGILEQARQSAMRLGTWVWVGVADTSPVSGGEPQLTIVTLSSRDGSNDISSSNLALLTKVCRINHAKTTTLPENGVFVLGTTSGGFPLKWSVAQREVDFSMVIGFSPRGEATAEPNQLPEWIKLSFMSATNSNDTVTLLVAGPSGQVVVAR
jgi:prepilin-type N-terminal cleavage/methylation domain-containing protein